MPYAAMDSAQLLLLQNLREAGPTAGLWRELVIRLYQNDVTPSVNSVLADFTECDFSGYVAKVLSAAWLMPFIDANGIPRMMSTQNQFDHDGGAVANSVFGYSVEKDTGELLWAERFADGPFNVALVTDAVSLTLAIAAYALISAEVVGS